MDKNQIEAMDKATHQLVRHFMICDGTSMEEAMRDVQEFRKELGELNWFTIVYHDYLYGPADEWDWNSEMFKDEDIFAYAEQQEFLELKDGYEKALGEEISYEKTFNLIKATMDILR